MRSSIVFAIPAATVILQATISVPLRSPHITSTSLLCCKALPNQNDVNFVELELVLVVWILT
jgi:hypothetical protein